MDAMKLLEQLRAEKEGLEATIRTLEARLGADSHGPASRGVNVPNRHGRVMSAAAKAAMSKKLKQVWAAKKRAQASRSAAAKKRAGAKLKAAPKAA